MGRVGDDAGQAAGIEQSLFQIEVPGARLLGHQFALQAVGELGHHALQMQKLLVELLAQAGQFVRLAQFGSVDGLVVSGGVDAIGLFGRFRRRRRGLLARRAASFLAAMARHHDRIAALAFALLRFRALGLAHGAVAALGARGAALIGALFLLGAGLAALALAFLLVGIGVGIGLLERLDIEGGDHVAYGAGEAFLIRKPVFQRAVMGGQLAFDEVAPIADRLARRGRQDRK